ncbi:cytidine deaminase-like protein [Hygrophoropsis aurantiaca]|uniref:Cytidine deaminase-like protein n=1 Tax=Hygrophoropsis aurantiaca TaxID=72124 RepID=A0ACB8ASP2_9AGAM|nr:cytidine deaminase-like protein [Hygrophoropsis aurantiaca]
MNSPVTPSPSPIANSQLMTFNSPASLLDHVTQEWRSNFVTVDLDTPKLVNFFSRRPFFMLTHVDAPLFLRYNRSNRHLHSINATSLENFVRQNDQAAFGTDESTSVQGHLSCSGFRTLRHLIKLSIVNSFQTISELHTYLDSLDMTNLERLRPQWDTYFMTLADLASQRSNCMKRRVGAILVKENRIVATGYNGTPRGVTNCNEGGCPRCNRTSAADILECLCLHAEENALLEAGRDRVGKNAIIYCNTCPCLKCTIKIIQSGVTRVVYNLSYKVDEASAKLFKEAGIELSRHTPPPEA